MSNNKSIEDISINPVRKLATSLHKDEEILKWAEEFSGLVKRCYREKPNKKDLLELRCQLSKTPKLYQVVFDLADTLNETLMKKMINQKPVIFALRSNIEVIKDEEGYEHSPIIEKMLIENIALTWLRYQWAEFQLNTFMGRDVRMAILEYWERRASAAQRRYLRSIETLARVRKLARNTPALQVNIATDGGQQVNVGGDLTR